MILPLALGLALQAATPTLQRREQPAEPIPGEQTHPHDSLPANAEGEYRWRETGEIIELFLDNHHLDGYLTRRSDRHNPRSAPLTFTFAQGSAFHGDITFTTRQVHGDSYVFLGHLVPNSTPAPHEGPWRLTGTLTLRSGKDSTSEELSAPLSLGGSFAEE